ncbi:conjugal transfer protein TraB [Embleya sp. NPDC020886]|uniref:conjugal transfer protein TraB n=1 Tax=Embleya sp. NPDC020886 TaxID=3363980 RepID=UPI0037A0F20F
MSSDLVPIETGRMVRADDAGFPALQEQFSLLATASARLQEQLGALARRMRRTADLSVTTGEMCAAAEVDPRHIGQIGDVSVALSGVADTALALAATAEALQMAAVVARRAHDMEYRGVYEAVQATSSRQAKAGFYRVR